MGEFGYSKDALRAIVGLTGEFVGTTDALTITNKTIVEADNTIKQTTPALGSIFVDNGTKFVARARPAANLPLHGNSGGTDIEYSKLEVAGGGTGLTTATGVIIGTGTTAMTVKTNPAGAFLGDSDIQNISGKKTYVNQTLGLRNPAGTATLTFENPAITADAPFRFHEPYKYLVETDGTTIWTKDGTKGHIAHSGTNVTTEIQWAIDNLTAGRTYPEVIKFKGNFVVPASIYFASNVEFDFTGANIKLGNTVNAPMFRNTNFTTTDASRDQNITFRGGHWDGNNANNAGAGYSFISCQTCMNLLFTDMYIHDAKYALAIQGCKIVRINACHFKTMIKMGIYVDGDVTYSAAALQTVITNCIAQDCDINGIYGHGVTTSIISYGWSCTNCITFNCDVAGIYLDERLYGYCCASNYCFDNGTLTVGGGIFINGEEDGTPYYYEKWAEITGNVCWSNAYGMMASSCNNIHIHGNTFAENDGHGLLMINPKNNMINNNFCVNNSQNSANTYSGIILQSKMGETVPDGALDLVMPVFNNTITNNRCYDDQGTKTQKYGIQIFPYTSANFAYGNIIKRNDVRFNRTGGIDTIDLSNCYDNDGFTVNRGKYIGVHPTESCEGILQGAISTFTNGATATIAKTIDSTGTHMTFTTAATTSDTCGGRTTLFTERDQQAVFKCKFKLSSIGSDVMYIGFHSTSDTPLTTITSILANKSGAGIFYDSSSSANWRILTNNGAGSTTNTDSTIAATTSVHEITMFFNNTQASLIVILDNVLVTAVPITTGVPATTTDLGLYWVIQTSTTVTKTLDVWDIEVLQQG